MNKDKRTILYKKVKHFAATHPKKNVRFDIHPYYGREECLKDDLKFLRNINYSPPVPDQSEVCCEQYHTDVIEGTTLTEDEIWDFVFSDDWDKFSSIRICEGELLTTLLQFLYAFAKRKKLNTFKMAKFDTVDHVIQPKSKLKKKPQGNKDDLLIAKIPVKIKFTYFSVSPDHSSPLPQINVDHAQPLNASQLSRNEVSGNSMNVYPADSEKISTSSIQSTKSFSTVSECGDSLQSVAFQFSDTIGHEKSDKQLEAGSVKESKTQSIVSKIDSDISEIAQADIKSSTGFLPVDKKQSSTTATPSDCMEGITSFDNVELEQTATLVNMSENQMSIENVASEQETVLIDMDKISSDEKLQDSASVATNEASQSVTSSIFMEKVATSSYVQTLSGIKTNAFAGSGSFQKLLCAVPSMGHVIFEANPKKRTSKRKVEEIVKSEESLGSIVEEESTASFLKPSLIDPDEHLIESDTDLSELYFSFKESVARNYISTTGENDVKNHISQPKESKATSYMTLPKESETYNYIGALPPKLIMPQRRRLPSLGLVSSTAKSHNSRMKSSHIQATSALKAGDQDVTKLSSVIHPQKSIHEKLKIPSATHPHRGILKKRYQMNQRCSETNSYQPKCDIYLKIIENRKKKEIASKLEGSLCDSIRPHSRLEILMPGEQIQRNTNDFHTLVHNYSIKLLKINRENDHLPKLVPSRRSRSDVVDMIEGFLDEKYGSKLDTVVENANKRRSISLNPVPFASYRNAKIISRPNSPYHDDVEKVPEGWNCFKQKVPHDFKDKLIRACEEFILRKEQVTFSNSWKTITYVTINRRLPLKKKELEDC